MGIETFGGVRHHESRGFHVGIRASQGELYSLVLTDRTVEYHALFGVAAGAIEKPAAVAHTLRSDQNPLRVQAVEQIAESLAFLPNQIFPRHFYIIEEHLSRRMIDHGADRANCQPLPGRLA